MIEEAEVVLHEADEPDSFGDLSDADGLACEGATEIDLASTDADPPAGCDGDGSIVERVLELAAGASRPWQETLEKLTGTRSMDAAAVTESFAPLAAWLRERNAGKYRGWEG